MQSDAPRAQRGASRSLNLIIYESAHAGKLPPVKRVALFLPGRVKQRKHESAHVSSWDPVQSTGFSKQTITRDLFNDSCLAIPTLPARFIQISVRKRTSHKIHE